MIMKDTQTIVKLRPLPANFACFGIKGAMPGKRGILFACGLSASRGMPGIPPGPASMKALFHLVFHPRWPAVLRQREIRLRWGSMSLLGN